MKIRTKLILFYLLGAILTSVTGLFVIQSYRSIQADFTVVMEDPIKKVEALKEVEQSALKIIAATSDYSLIVAEENDKSFTEQASESQNTSVVTNAAQPKIEKAVIIDEIKNYYQVFSKYENLVRESGFKTEDNVEAIRSNGEAMIETSAALVKLKQSGASGTPVLEKKEEVEIASRKFHDAVDNALQYQYDLLAEKKQNVENTIFKSTRDTVLFSGFAFLMALGSGYFISKSITEPINTLKDATNRVGNGNLDSEIAVISRDEIGDLAIDFQKMTWQLRNSHNELLKNHHFVENIIGSMADFLVIVEKRHDYPR